MGKKTGGFILGALIGGAAAAATALLFSPKSGKELRAALADKADELKDQLVDYTDIAIEKGIELSSVAKASTEDIRVKLQDQASQFKDTVTKSAVNLKEEVANTVSKVQENFASTDEETSDDVVTELVDSEEHHEG